MKDEILTIMAHQGLDADEVLQRPVTLAEAIETGNLTEAEANVLREHLQDTGLGYGPHPMERWIDVFDALATELGQ